MLATFESVLEQPGQYLAQAYYLARNSPDRSNQTGALVFNKRGLRAGDGWNHFPPGFELTPEELFIDGQQQDAVDELKKQKYSRVAHAEFTAVVSSYRNLQGGVMVAPWATCNEYAKSIVLSGLKNLVVHKERMDLTPSRWLKDIATALIRIKANGIQLIKYSGPVDADPVYVNGSLWSPRTLSFVDK